MEQAENKTQPERVMKGEGMARRDKTWDELDGEEQVTRLRNVLRGVEHQLQRQMEAINNINATISKLSRHTHAQDGSACIPLQNGIDYPIGYIGDAVPHRPRHSDLD